MPKSRFNAVREKARVQRHNPIQREKDDAAAAVDATLSIKAAGARSNSDVLPVLKSLPSPKDTSNAVATSHEDTLWALTSLTEFLSIKSLRKELLAPKHDLVARILAQMQGARPIEVRDAASGCLRNLCIEAPGQARKALEERSCVLACLAELQRVARTLHLIDGKTDGDDGGMFDSQAASTAPRDLSFLSKPESEMNRKERRHAAKIKEAAAKGQAKEGARANGVKPSVNASAADQSMDVEGGQEQMNGDGAEVNDDDDRAATRCSHLSNLSAVLWCLVEMSPQTVQQCEEAAPVLCRIFAQAVKRGMEALRALRSDASGNNGTGKGKVNVGKKDQMVVERAWVEVASVSLNALMTLSDSNVRICAALLGISRQELLTVLKGKGRSGAVVLDEAAHDDLSRAEGRDNLATLCAAVRLAQEAVQNRIEAATTSDIFGRQACSLGLLSLAVLRNAQSSLPGQLSAEVKVVSGRDATSVSSLAAFESQKGLALLLSVMGRTADLSADVLAAQLPTSTRNAAARNEEEYSDPALVSGTQRQAQEEVANVTLALEVLAELVSDRESWSRDSATAVRADDEAQGEDDDEEMDVEGDSDEEGDDVDKEMMQDDTDAQVFGDGMEDSQQTFNFAHTRIAKAFSALESVQKLAFDVPEDSIALTATHDAAAALRGIVIRALSVLSNALLVIASYGQPPPSQPTQDEKQAKRIATFQAWLAREQQSKHMAQLWCRSFEMASRAAGAPIVAQDGPSAPSSEEEAQQTARIEGRRVVESCLGIMWSIGRCYEGMDEAASKVLAVESAQFTSDPHCTVAPQGNGVVDSLVAAYKSSEQYDTAALASATDTTALATVSATGADPTTWASADGVRVHCLGVLATLARQSHVWPTHLPSIATLLVRVLDALPRRGGAAAANGQESTSDAAALAAMEVRAWTSMDGMVVAVNGLIDTFADEARPWDAQYGALKLQGKLQRAAADVRAAARSIDKRKHSSLRLAADEASDNLKGFLQYRSSLKA